MRLLTIPALLILCLGSSQAQTTWHTALWGANGNYWSLRVPIVLKNSTNEDMRGYALRLRVGKGQGELPIAGEHRARLRVCSAGGTEYLYQVASPRRDAVLREGDEICFAVDVPAGRGETIYVYAGNPNALPVDLDEVNTSLRNGNFEEGDRTPAYWNAGLTSLSHLALYRKNEGRGGSACVYHRVQPGAAPQWVQWSQARILVTPGRRYLLRGWVRARNVKGQVGYYVHVNGVRPQMVNIVQSAGEGTYDWRLVEIRFQVPPGGQTATVGTVLYGAGEAWYDDVTLEQQDGGESPVLWHILPVERMNLKAPSSRQTTWRTEWLVRASVVVRHFGEDAVQKAVAVSLPRAVHMVRRLVGSVRLPLRAQVVDMHSGQSVPAIWVDGWLYFLARLQPLSEHRFGVFLSREPAGEEWLRSYEKILHSPMNLAREGDFESRERALQLWSAGGEATGSAGFSAEVVSSGKFGRNALRLRVPPERKADWLGWRLLNVPVQPSSRYLYAAWVKTEGITGGSVDIHGHFKRADNSLSQQTPFFSSVRRLTGDNDWTLCTSQIVTPSDVHHVELHLTMNVHGTVWHDGVLFVPVEEGTVLQTEANPALLPRDLFALWQVNPLVKVFPDDPPAATSRQLAIECARNEWEPVQIALWSRQPLRGVTISVSSLRHASGATLPAPRLYLVKTVPVDIPTNYYVSRLPDYCRHVPQGMPSSDGWAGEWPDPLMPLQPFHLPAGRTQAVWIDCYVPASAPAGEYRGTVTVQAGGKRLLQVPLHVTVWGFILPRRSHLRIVYDLRSGPGWDVTGGEDPETLKRWYRLMAEHRVNPDVVLPAPEFRYENGRVVMDASRFEPIARYAFDELGFNHCYTPWLFYALGWAYPLPPKFGLQPRTPEYERAVQDAYRQLVDLFTRNGWRDRLVYYLSDEPFLGNRQVVEDLRYFISIIKPVAPDVPIFSSTWGHSPELDGYLTMWGIGQYGVFPVQKMRERRTAGDRLLFTTDGQQCLDTPYLATERLLPLYCFVYDVEGYEFWGFSWWPYNPWQKGWHQYISQSDQGQEFYWIRYPNGDGYIAYPGEPVGSKEPLPSIRLKAVREGAEDYEYYLLWKQAVERAKQAGKDVSAAEALYKQMEALAPIPNAGGLRSTQILPDPQAVYRLRKEIAGQIMQWGQ